MTEGEKNLSMARGARNVWDEPRSSLASCDIERWVAVAGGSGLAMLGARRSGFSGGMMAMLGSVLAVRAAMGRHDLRVARNWVERSIDQSGWRVRDTVQDASEDSFPASDAPAFTGAD